jgi:glycosyltransferase involved in cell wall biosynthesis
MTGPPPGVVVAGLLPGSGYGNATRDYLTLLDGLGVAVQWVPLQNGSTMSGPDHWAAPRSRPLPPTVPNARLAVAKVDPVVALFHTPREFWVRLAAEHPAPRMLAYTTFEQTVLPETTVRMLNELDGVLVPSRFNADSFRASGVAVPMWVVPHVVESIVGPGAPRGDGGTALPAGVGPDTFVVSVVGPWQARKAIPASIEAFLRAFGPDEDVLLVVKTGDRDFLTHQPTPLSVARLLGRHGRVPPVHLINRYVRDDRLAALVRRSDCSLSLSRGEGFGLTIAEAIAAGTPAVVTGWGGPPEYLGANYPLFVDHTMIEVASEPTDGWAETTGEWALADMDHAASLLRWVRDHRDAASDAVTVAQRQLSKTCAPHVVALGLLDALGLGGGVSANPPL